MLQPHEWLGSLPAAAIAVLGWCYAIFLLNKFSRPIVFTTTEKLALCFFLLGGYGAWISELCILHRNLIGLQVCASLYRTFVNWYGFTLIVNGHIYVTKQQVGALGIIVAVTILWQVQHRLMLT